LNPLTEKKGAETSTYSLSSHVVLRSLTQELLIQPTAALLGEKNPVHYAEVRII
jgi:hypothetical protein